jgi:hypothetical protein
MKNFRKICSTVVLTLMFALPVLAGDIQTPTKSAPGDIDSPGRSAPGEIHGPGLTAPGDMGNPGRAIFIFVIQLLT